MAEHLTVTPSGAEIRFEDGEPDPDTGKSKRRAYTVDGEKYPSVTTALGVLDKAGLKFAAEKLAVEGAIKLAQQGDLPNSVDGALAKMKAQELRFWQIWNQKSDRGTVSHEDLVSMVMGEALVDLDSYPEDQKGMISGLSGWVADERPVISEAEVAVASKVHEFAGRHDLFGILPRQHPTAKCLLDLKTTERLPRTKGGEVKPPYPEMLLQLGGYQLARAECGYEPAEYQAVLRVDASGAWDLFTTVVDPEWFLSVLDTYRALRAVPTKPSEVAA